ncbi:cell division protein FtsQ/DivIB [Marinomonas vulgaris]|uniref:cell division protein FtsQ/DivIB n=1 Tax=Marinomonas vulgaris TaxID=2823372 RepID=UPI002E2D0979|nr:cell division protein FtsQ/DivIB [Marinomonas vulgaris]
MAAFFQGDDSSEEWFAIEKVEIQGDLEYTTHAALESEYVAFLGRSLLSVSLSEVLSSVLSSEWVQSAEIRKVWPNTLQILVHEHTPLAYWRNGQLISTSADIISPRRVPELPLTHLHGPEDASDIVLEQFGLVSQVLSSSTLKVSVLTLEPRGAWRITFANGIEVKLGRDDILERLQRFIAVYESDLSGRMGLIDSVDARYPHGVAVSWKENK